MSNYGDVALRVRLRRGDGPMVRSDRTLLGRVLANLISNAIKYADPGKGAKRAVLVAIVALSDHVRVEVIDNGVGIARSQWSEVFKPFVQLDNPGRNREQGLGLGLSIVQATMDLLEGHHIALRSTERRGTRISLQAPRQPRSLHTTTPALTGDNAASELTSLYIWCVEDDDMAREAVAALLEELGILTEHSPSLEHLERALGLAERAPDLVITDFRLPGGHTAEDVAQAFHRRWGDGIPVLVLTGEVSPLGALVARKRTIILRKPVSPATLIRSIKQLCSSAQTVLEAEETGRAWTPPRSDPLYS